MLLFRVYSTSVPQDGLLHGLLCTYFLRWTVAIILFCRSKMIEMSTSFGLHFLFYSLEENFVFSNVFLKHLLSGVINWIFVKQMGKINIFVLFHFPDVG